MNYVIALVICAAAALVEGLCAGPDPMAKLRRLEQPTWSPPNWLWVAIGLAWYAICFTALVRLLAFWPESRLPVVLLTALMLANGGVNILQFRLNRLDLAFFFLFPYWFVLAGFLWATCPHDRLACALFAGYAVYQIYAGAWGYQLWRMNRMASQPRPSPRASE